MDDGPELLLRARRAAGLSQSELARRAGLHRSVVNAYERGTRQPGANALIALLRAAGFELRLRPVVDPVRNARILAQVLDLAERLPSAPSGELEFPPFRERVG